MAAIALLKASERITHLVVDRPRAPIRRCSPSPKACKSAQQYWWRRSSSGGPVGKQVFGGRPHEGDHHRARLPNRGPPLALRVREYDGRSVAQLAVSVDARAFNRGHALPCSRGRISVRRLHFGLPCVFPS